MMHFSTSDENFRKKLPHGCKIKFVLTQHDWNFLNLLTHLRLDKKNDDL